MATGAGGEKKISFGFSKSIKKSVISKNTIEEKKLDFIECFDDKAIKIVGGVEKKDEPLVIPMLGSKTWHDRILNKVNADIFEPKIEPTTNGELNHVKIKQEVTEDTSGVTVTCNDNPQLMEVVTVKEEKPEEPEKTLEEQAAQEILQDLQLPGGEVQQTHVPVVPLPEDESLIGKKEPTLEDYEQVPIEKYGEAMLRGMGWQPGKGIGKNEKIVSAVIPDLRPRGMGLGADKLKIQNQIAASKLAENENLKIVKGAFVKIIAGKQTGNYGQIAGLDDEGGRLMIKLALGGEIISVNEAMVQPVSKDEYNKNAKVLNSKKYDEYKIKAEKKDATAEEILLNDSSEGDNTKRDRDRNEKSRDRKKLKKHKRYSSDDDSDSERRFRKRRNSSDSEEDHKRKKSKKNKQYSNDDDAEAESRSRKKRNSSESDGDRKRKKSKKTKKSKRRDSSSERTSHKSKRKTKKKGKESRDSPKREKYKHRRSRSRSPRRR